MRCIILIILTFIYCSNGAYATNIKEIKIGESLTAWVVEEHSLPILSFKLIFRNAGYAYDPEDKLGLANLALSLLSEGAGDYDSLAYQKKLEELAIRLNISADKDNIYVNITTLKEHYKQAINLLMMAIAQPHLKIEEIERIKKQIKISIENNQQNPQYLASLNWQETVYKNHPYSNIASGTSATLDNIGKNDIANYIADNFKKENLIISIVGDITEAEAVAVIENSFDKLPVAHFPAKEIADITQLPQGSYSFVEKPNPQSVVMFGLNAVRYKDEDFYPAYVLNYILGGGSFESRLVEIIREKHGLVYSVYSYLSIPKHAAILSGSLATKNESLKRAIGLLKDSFRNLQQNGVTSQELSAAKQYLIGSYALRMDTNSKLAGGIAFLQIEGLGIDFMSRRNSLVRNVTLEQVNDVARKYLNPDDLIISVVGGKN